MSQPNWNPNSIHDLEQGTPWQTAWSFPEGNTYLNHGSFGPAPAPVIEAKQRWLVELERQPMDFYIRRMEPLLDQAMERLAALVGSSPANMAFVPNATTGMNIVAGNLSLQAGDEVLLNDHEYGAVFRIWEKRCEAVGASVVTAILPRPLGGISEFVDALFAKVTSRTRLIVISHVTSQTATVFPVQAVCQRATELGVRVCIDGPHAIAMVPVNLKAIGCDYYVASCHKWLSAPLGTGFLYVREPNQHPPAPSIVSWGRSLSGRPNVWQDEFHWSGTYDPSGYLAIPDAIAFLESVGWQVFRDTTWALAQYAREVLIEVTGGIAITPTEREWSGPMVTVSLPKVAKRDAWPGTPHPLQVFLWEAYRIEAPVFEWRGVLCLRASCHLYNRPADIRRLAEAIRHFQRM